MALVKQGKIVEDSFQRVTDEAIPTTGAVLVDLATWQAQREQLKGRAEPVGVVLKSDEHPEVLADDLPGLALVALDFPTFRDGRAYSYARLLRDRYEFTGELRAVGDVLLEQLLYMQRCGFDAFEIESDDPERDFETALADFTVWYQPAGDDRASALQLRHRR